MVVAVQLILYHVYHLVVISTGEINQLGWLGLPGFPQMREIEWTSSKLIIQLNIR